MTTGLAGAMLPTLGLMAALGLRHGLDPDHVAVIDNIVFRMVDERPRLAPWTGTLFAIGHSLAMGAVAIGVAMLAGRLPLPRWSGSVIDAMVVALLLLVGTLNLATLLRPGDYAPVGWRARLLPSSLRTSTHPAAVLVTGVLFGLVFDTATQAAAWGAAASARGGVAAAIVIALAFSVGMTLSDTLDSQIVSRLLSASRDGNDAVRRYRRAVGWLIVALSYGMALVAVLDASRIGTGLDDTNFTIIGVSAALLVASLLMRARGMERSP